MGEMKSLTFPGLEGPYSVAPGGYGYGDVPVHLGSTTDDTVFLEKLNEQFDKTVSRTRQVTFVTGGATYIGTLWNAGNGYGALTAICYTDAPTAALFTRVVRNRVNGTWQPWEYENPPLGNKTEYRTTERYGAKPVYIKRINYGALAVAKSTVVVELGELGAENIVDYSIVTTNASGSVHKQPAHSLYEGTLMCSAYVSKSENCAYIYTHTDMSAYNAVVTVKYTKV